MKFLYVDETGDQGQGDAFVMAGLLIDAYRLRKHTATFDEMISTFLAKHRDAPKELKTKQFINGTHGWSKVGPDQRKEFLTSICDLAAECARIFAIGISLKSFQAACAAHPPPFAMTYWVAAAMFVASILQKKMQGEPKNKGLTVLIFDENMQEMANLSDALYKADAWFDPLYQKGTLKRQQRFDQIINSAFAIKSHHSSLIQVADAVAYIYRRHLELHSEQETWDGEKEYFAGLVHRLRDKREHLGRTPDGQSVEFYKAARHGEWDL